MKKFKPKAFTLVELIVVIAIIAILGTVGTLSLTQWFGKAEDANRTAISENLQTAMETSLASDGNLPTPGESYVLSGSGGDAIWEQGTITENVAAQLQSYDMPEDLEFTSYLSKSANGSTYQIAVPKAENGYIIKGKFNGYIIDNGGSGTGDIYSGENMFLASDGINLDSSKTIADTDPLLGEGNTINEITTLDWSLDNLSGLTGSNYMNEEDVNYIQSVIQGAINGVRVYDAQ